MKSKNNVIIIMSAVTTQVKHCKLKVQDLSMHVTTASIMPLALAGKLRRSKSDCTIVQSDLDHHDLHMCRVLGTSLHAENKYPSS